MYFRGTPRTPDCLPAKIPLYGASRQGTPAGLSGRAAASMSNIPGFSE
jgi:hypothetical protein